MRTALSPQKLCKISSIKLQPADDKLSGTEIPALRGLSCESATNISYYNIISSNYSLKPPEKQQGQLTQSIWETMFYQL